MPRNLGQSRGFSLIELMIAVAIIGILASIAIPNYNDYVTKAKITEAVSSLSDMRVKMERHFQDNRTYVGACAAGTQAPLPTATKYFTFDCPELTTTTYTLRATGIGNLSDLSYTLDQSNTRRTASVPAGWTLPASNCWALGKSGGC